MRLERKHLGDRVRLILNRHEVERAARTFIGKETDIMTVFLHQTKKFEHACRVVAATQFIVPKNASFVVGSLSDSGISGVTFEWFESINEVQT